MGTVYFTRKIKWLLKILILNKTNKYFKQWHLFALSYGVLVKASDSGVALSWVRIQSWHVNIISTIYTTRTVTPCFAGYIPNTDT